MFALVESGSITKLLNGNKGIELNGVKHSAAIYSSAWTEAERNNIGIYTVQIDDTNFKDSYWYVNTDMTYSFGSGKVTGAYGTATAKETDDTKWTQKQIDDGLAPVGADTDTVAIKGLKTILIEQVKGQAESELDRTDWYITRKTEKNTAIPSAISTHRDAVRSKQASMETSITNAANTAALETLYKRDGDGDRPIGDIPTLK